MSNIKSSFTEVQVYPAYTDFAQIENGEKTFYDRKFQEGDIVRHFKGGLYQIIAFATHTESGEELVVYKSLSDGRVWSRPLQMFTSKVDEKKYPDAIQPYRLIKVKLNFL